MQEWGGRHSDARSQVNGNAASGGLVTLPPRTLDAPDWLAVADQVPKGRKDTRRVNHSPLQDLSNQTVYIVDDDLAVLEAIDKIVRGLGLRSKCFSDSEEFVTSISSGDTGCLILDIHMPHLDGFQVLEQLEAKQCHVSAIIITADADVPMKVLALGKGARAFLQKPFDPRTLVAEIQGAIGSKRPPRERVAE
jgi:CheY-like chemotaxis protein